MTEPAAGSRRLLSLGALARRALAEGAAGGVTACFPSSAYLALGSALVCLGGPGLSLGPLNLLAELAPGDLAGLAAGDPAACRGGELAVGRLRLALAGAEVWQAPPAPAWDRASLARGLAWLNREVAAGRLALASPLLGADPSACGLADFLAETARPALVALAAWLEEAWHDPAPPSRATLEAVAGLLGLGPGLTPAGDDFLGGLLLALNRLGRRDLARPLAEALLPLAAARTHPISTAHLKAAAQGEGGTELLAALDALLAGRTDLLPERLAAVGRIGHSSGWDALAGALPVLRCCLTADSPPARDPAHSPTEARYP